MRRVQRGARLRHTVEYGEEAQRSWRGCSGARMPRYLRDGALTARMGRGPPTEGSMHPLAQVLLDGIFTGSTYALMAAGLALILGVVKVVNLSHGAFFSLGAYIAYVLSAKGGSHPADATLPAALIPLSLPGLTWLSIGNP